MKNRVATDLSEPNDGQYIIRTSEPKWFEKLAKVYKDRKPFTLIDDAKVGIDPAKQTLLSIGKKSNITRQEWTGVLVALGMSVLGVGLIIATIFDPEATSKLGLLIASGAVIIFGGGLTAIRILTKLRPPSVTVNNKGFRIEWD